MKFIFILFISFFSVSLYSQKSDSKDGKTQYQNWIEKRNEITLPKKDGIVTFEKIDSIRVVNKNRGDLVTAFKLTLSDVLRQAKSAIDVDDREGGLVVAKVYDNYSFVYKKKTYYKPIRYTIKFQSKEGRLRIQLTNIEVGNEELTYNGYTINTEIIYSKLEEREQIIVSEKNFKKLSFDGKARSLIIKQSIENHLTGVLESLVNMTVKRSNDNF